MRLRRSDLIIFGLGLAGFIFLVWAWLDSPSHTSSLGHYGSKRIILSNRYAAIRLFIAPNPAAPSGWWVNRSVNSPIYGDELLDVGDGAKAGKLFIAPGHEVSGEPLFGWDYSSYWLPHWMLLAAYLGIWITLTAWHWRTRRSRVRASAMVAE